MQIKCLHKNIYKLNNYALSQQKLEEHRKKYESPVRKWQNLKLEGLSDKTCQYATGISRATCFRYSRVLKQLAKWILLPPKRPQRNGGVERGSRIFEEFYARGAIPADSIGALRIDLKKALQKYNSYRPHNALKGLTPLEYINTVLKVAA